MYDTAQCNSENLCLLARKYQIDVTCILVRHDEKLKRDVVGVGHYGIFSNSLIHEPKTKKISGVDYVWKSEEEITKNRPNFTSIFSRNTG